MQIFILYLLFIIKTIQKYNKLQRMSSIKNSPFPNTKLICNLHSQPFSLYCDRCLEPVCQKCTFIGPHHTSIHSLTSLPQAYQRRVQEINTRLAKLSQTRDIALNKIIKLTSQIEYTKLQTQQIVIQNDKNRVQIEQRLQKSYQNIISQLGSQQQLILEQLNNINDLGHQFEQLSLNNDIDCLINYEGIIEDLRQVIDKLDILLEKAINIDNLPKQLSELRVKLKQIQTYQQLYKHKVQIIKAFIKKLYSEVKKIQAPRIDYEQKLQQINALLKRFDDSFGEYNTSLDKPNLKKSHFVCHFCGIIMNDISINTLCSNNKINEQMKSTQKYFTNVSKLEVNSMGYCKKQPDVAKFGTHRHFFGESASPEMFFRIVFLGWVLGQQIIEQFSNLLPQSDRNLLKINEQIYKNNNSNSFINYLQLLFLKIATLGKIKQKQVDQLFEDEDINEKDECGYCNVISMQYNLMEVIGLNEAETSIILSICNFKDKQLDKKDNESESESQKEKDKDKIGKKEEDIRNYKHFVDKIKEIQI